MSRIEETLMEAWRLGIKDLVMERASKKRADLEISDKWMNMEDIYDQAMEEIKRENIENGSGN